MSHSQKGFFLPCPSCQGVRLHIPKQHTEDTGKIILMGVCTACECETPFPLDKLPGIACRKCGDCRLKAVTGPRRQAIGVMRQTKRCKTCCTKIRLKLVAESYSC